MVHVFDLNSWGRRITILVVLLAACAILGATVLSHFITNTLSDDGVIVLRSTLASAAAYFPQSARLQARLARVELAETMGDTADMARVEAAAIGAVRLAPWSSNNHMLLASVRNVQGDLEAAETSLRSAVKLAPHSTQAHWQLANLLVRQGNIKEAIKEFQVAIAVDSSTNMLPGTLDVVWNISEGNPDTLMMVVGSEPKKRLLLAQYLLKQERAVDAVTVCKSIERKTLLADPATTEFLDTLIATGQLDLAKDLWDHLVAPDKSANGQVLYNGSFEQELIPSLAQFDWKVSHSEYATLSLDSVVARTGKRSLRFNLTGRNTMVLGKELRQMGLLKPSLRYRLECYGRTESLITTESIYIVVADTATLAPIAVSNPIAKGSTDWQPYSLDFIAPAKSKAVFVTIKRTPRFSYDEPSKGTLWLDDFALREVGQGK